MKLQPNRYFRGLLISVVYLTAVLGIVASGGGGGGGSVSVESIMLDQSPSPTFDHGITVTGELIMDLPDISDIGDKYSDTVNVEWVNESTGQTGSRIHEFSGFCEPNIRFPIFSNDPVYCGGTNERGISIPFDLAIGDNKIVIEADGKEASFIIVRLDDRVPPDAPSYVNVVATDGGADISWSIVPRTDSYNIYYASDPGVTKENYSILPNGTKLTDVLAPYSVVGLDNESVYYFTVTAENGYGESVESSEVTTIPPEVPMGLTVQALDSSAELSWNLVAGAITYNIYFASSPGVTKANYQSLPGGGKVTGAASPQIVSGLSNGQVYYFVVTSVNWIGESSESAEVMTTAPGAPTGISVKALEESVELNWSTVSDAVSYNIYYAASSGVGKSNYASLPEGSMVDGVMAPYTITGLNNGTTYYFVVTAVNWSGESSDTQELATTPYPTSGPVAVKGSAANGELTVTWDPVSFASSYNLYIATVSGVNKSNFSTIKNGRQFTNVTSPFLISNLSNEGKYHVVLTQVNSLGESDESLELVASPGSSGWTWQNPVLPGGNYFEVEFLDTENGWIVGDGGHILKTSDGGNTWISTWNGASLFFTDVSVIDTNNIWVAGHMGVNPNDLRYFLLNSSDGGANWFFWGVPAGTHIDDIDFVSPSTGWMVGDSGFYFTDSGGDSWKKQSALAGNLVNAIDENDARAIVDFRDFHMTIDSGQSWNRVAEFASHIYGLEFEDVSHGWAVPGGSSSIFITMDGGNSWSNRPSVLIRHQDVSFSDTANGWTVGSFLDGGSVYDGGIARSTNGGFDWVLQSSTVSTPLTSLSAVDSDNAWVVGEEGVILKTSDGGATWIQQSLNLIFLLGRPSSVDFVDASNGWISGNGVVNSSDGGSTWTVQIPPSDYLNDLDFVNTTTGWAVGDSGRILNTMDSGLNWSDQNCTTGNDLNAVSFIDSSTGWVVGDFGSVCRTFDGGITWDYSKYDDTLTHLQDVSFANATTGWAVGFNTLLYTEDGGMSWISQRSGNFVLYSVFALNSSTVWAAGGHRLYKTTNGGTTWIDAGISGFVPYMRKVYFVDSLNGWVGTEQGEIYVTSDGGTSWIQQSSNSSSFSDVVFVNQEVGWYVGGNDSPQVLKTDSAGFGP